MKIAIAYNRDSKNVINLFGIPNRERIGQETIKRLVDAFKAHKHRVRAFEGDILRVVKLELSFCGPNGSALFILAQDSIKT